jgi:hypothetical protein
VLIERGLPLSKQHEEPAAIADERGDPKRCPDETAHSTHDREDV